MTKNIRYYNEILDSRGKNVQANELKKLDNVLKDSYITTPEIP